MQWSFWLGDKKRNQLVRLSKNEMLNLCVPFSYKVEASLEKEEEEEEEEKEKEKEKEKEEEEEENIKVTTFFTVHLGDDVLSNLCFIIF